MNGENSHYFSRSPDGDIKIHTVSASLKRHLYIFKTLPGVFSYKKIDLGTEVMIKHMYIPTEESFLLDLGCGYGPIGIVVGHESPKSIIYMIDINKRAIWCAKENVKLNLPISEKRVNVLEGNYFEPIKEKNQKFDGIYMNPPQRKGRKEFLNLCNIIPDYLKEKGWFQFVVRKKMGAPFIYQYLTSHFKNARVEIICKRSGYWLFNCIFNL